MVSLQIFGEYAGAGDSADNPCLLLLPVNKFTLKWHFVICLFVSIQSRVWIDVYVL